MTVLDLDPPPPSLRLVSSNGAPIDRDHRYRDGAPLHGAARDLYREVLEQALVWQAPIDPDALRVVLATKQNTTASPARAFSAAAVWQLMFVDVLAWCRNRKLAVPAGCATALTRVIDYLDATNSFDELSDSAEAIYDAIDECTGGWDDVRHPSQPSPRARSSRAKASATKAAPPRARRGSLRSTRGSQRT